MTTPLPSSPAALRNRQPILDALRLRLPDAGVVLEIACGTGEHALFMAAALPGLRWLPSDADPNAIAVTALRQEWDSPPNLAPPVHLDVTNPTDWPAGPFDAIVCCNMIHIAPWSAAEGLMAGAGRVLRPDGALFLYGPFVEADRRTAPSNLAFDASLKSRDPRWGVRDLAAVDALAATHGLRRAEQIEMPANNLMLAYKRP